MRPLAWLLALVGVAALATSTPATPESMALLGVAAGVLVATVLAAGLCRGLSLPARALASGEPTADERCRHGSFRRQSNPDTPGCPQWPRAPGDETQPA